MTATLAANATRARPFLNATTPTSKVKAAVRGRLLDDTESWASLPTYEESASPGVTAAPAAKGITRAMLSEWEEFKASSGAASSKCAHAVALCRSCL